MESHEGVGISPVTPGLVPLVQDHDLQVGAVEDPLWSSLDGNLPTNSASVHYCTSI